MDRVAEVRAEVPMISVEEAARRIKADHTLPEEWRDPAFNDHDRPLITTCETGELAPVATK